MTTPTFVINTWTAWEEPPRARHQVASELATRYPVCFITCNRRGKPGLRIEQVDARLSVLRPFWPVDYRLRYRLPIVNGLYQGWLFNTLSRSGLIGGSSWVLNFDHTATRLSRFHRQTVYYCNDDHIGNAALTGFPISAYHRWAEERVATQASRCVGTSPYLVEKLSRYNLRTHLITLGAPELSFKPDPPAARHSPTGLRTIGLVGFINSRKVPVSLINRLAEGNSVRVVLVGPVSEDFRQALTRPERVILRGVLTGEALQREVAGFDVAIAPYDLSNSNKGVTPNKMWLYLALGKPVVVSPLPNLAAWDLPPGVIYQAGSEEEFLRMIDRAYDEDDVAMFHRRLKCATENSWPRKIDQLLELLGLRSEAVEDQVGVHDPAPSD